MNRFVLKFRPFESAFIDDMIIESETLLLAHEEFKKVFPRGVVIDIQPEEFAEKLLDNVIYVDFRLKKRVA